MGDMVSFAIKVKGNTLEAQRDIQNLFRKQVPFATAAALTQLAKEARDQQRSDVRERFTVRSARFPNTFRHVPAEKKTWPDTFSVVGVLDEWVARHEAGGTFRPGRSERWAIPGREIKRSPSGKIRKRNQPKEIIASGRGFLAIGETWSGRNRPDAILLKVGRSQRKIRLAFTLVRRARIDRRLKMETTVTRVAGDRYGPIFKKWFLIALN